MTQGNLCTNICIIDQEDMYEKIQKEQDKLYANRQDSLFQKEKKNCDNKERKKTAEMGRIRRQLKRETAIP